MSQGLATIEVDYSEFKKAVDRCSRESARSYPEFINDQLRELVIEMFKQTKSADVNRIRSEMGNFIKRERGKRGKLLKHAKFEYGGPSKQTYKIFEWIHKKKHGSGIPYGNIDDYIYFQIMRRLRSPGFLKAGWIPAMRILGGMKGKGMTVRGVKKYTTDYGTAKKAKWSGMNFSCAAEARNWSVANALGKLSAVPGKPMKYAMVGVQAAIRVRMASLQQYFLKKTNEVLARWLR